MIAWLNKFTKYHWIWIVIPQMGEFMARKLDLSKVVLKSQEPKNLVGYSVFICYSLLIVLTSLKNQCLILHKNYFFPKRNMH